VQHHQPEPDRDDRVPGQRGVGDLERVERVPAVGDAGEDPSVTNPYTAPASITAGHPELGHRETAHSSAVVGIR
jgi:hypothetical protein